MTAACAPGVWSLPSFPLTDVLSHWGYNIFPTGSGKRVVPKGDALITYAKPESVDEAVQQANSRFLIPWLCAHSDTGRFLSQKR